MEEYVNCRVELEVGVKRWTYQIEPLFHLLGPQSPSSRIAQMIDAVILHPSNQSNPSIIFAFSSRACVSVGMLMAEQLPKQESCAARDIQPWRA